MISQNVNAALILISAVVSYIFIPPLTGFLAAKSAPGYIKQPIVGLLALAEAVAAVALAGEWDITNLSATILAVLAAAGVSYKISTGEVSKNLENTGPQIGKDK